VGTVGIFSKLTIFHPYVYAYRYILTPLCICHHILEAYEEGARLHPDDPGIWEQQGDTLIELGRFEEALSAYEKAIQMRPGKGYLWRKKGHALKALGRKDEEITLKSS